MKPNLNAHAEAIIAALAEKITSEHDDGHPERQGGHPKVHVTFAELGWKRTPDDLGRAIQLVNTAVRNGKHDSPYEIRLDSNQGVAIGVRLEASSVKQIAEFPGLKDAIIGRIPEMARLFSADRNPGAAVAP